jgi:GR25 family glycosyltransferase involved in LPS biosynthesis
MKNFIICLPGYSKSMHMAHCALKSGEQHKWDVELFNGVDGSTVSANEMSTQWGLKINSANRKCQKQMDTRAGVRGCFLSHWLLWQQCVDLDQTIGIFEHDVEFLKPYTITDQFLDVLKLVEGFEERRPMPAGVWYEGTRGYLIKPTGAKKLINWVTVNGCLPSDIAIGKDVVDIVLNFDNYVHLSQQYNNKNDKHVNSFTWNLESMR